MKFVYPWMLALVAFVPVAGALWAFLRARSERRLAAFVAPGLQARLLPRSPRLFSLQAALLLAGLALVLFAAARPQWGQSAQQMQARSRNVVIALDVSRSMLAADIRPNRLERAKADLADLVRSLEGDRCALVVFRRTGELLCPLTTDYAFLRSAIEGASPDSAPRGETDLGSAIRKSLDALNPAKDEHNAIILISDGGDLRGGALEAARLAKKRSVPVFTVGLGNDKIDSAVPDASGTGAQTYKGQAVKTRLDNKTLETIARESGGRYVPLATAGTAETTLGAIYRRFLRQVAEEDIAEEEELRATERFGWFLVPGILLVLLAALFSRGRFAGRRARTVAAAALLVLCFGVHADEKSVTNAAPTSADEVQLTDGEVWNKGVDYYRAGDTTNALATLRPLMLRRTHGARAAEVVGAIRHADSARARPGEGRTGRPGRKRRARADAPGARRRRGKRVGDADRPARRAGGPAREPQFHARDGGPQRPAQGTARGGGPGGGEGTRPEGADGGGCARRARAPAGAGGRACWSLSRTNSRRRRSWAKWRPRARP